ncbi:MAG: bifunctional riboflavin kinase/FAD synthetase [Mycobacteriales bacterium]
MAEPTGGGIVQRWRGVADAPGDWGRCVVTIGVFDGVHRGHQQIIGETVRRARDAGLASVVVTFDPHPAEIVRPGSHPARLTSPAYQAELIEDLGVDVLCVLAFTRDFSRLDPAEFVHAVLVERLHTAEVVVGRNFRYGRRAAGDVQTLRRDGMRFGFSVDAADIVATGDRAYSSTYIRSCVDAGDVESASAALGRDHRLDGIVVRGDGRGGRELGYPTANLALQPYTAVPADGVYAGRVVLSAPGSAGRGVAGPRRLPAAISIGTNPTFDGSERRVEGHILDFDEDIYGEPIGCEFTVRLRATVRFESVGELIEQMGRDVGRTRELIR